MATKDSHLPPVKKGDNVRLWHGGEFAVVGTMIRRASGCEYDEMVISIHIPSINWCIPTHDDAITHVFRDGICIWQRDTAETQPKQLSLFD